MATASASNKDVSMSFSDSSVGDSELQRLLADIEQNIVCGQHSEGRRSLIKVRKTFKLLLRARTPEELEQFHFKCDGRGPTLTVLHGIYNVWFGGYTSKSWSAGKKDVKSDEHAFLFYKSDNKNDKCMFFDIKDVHKDRAITCDRSFGPTFGGTAFKDYDLQTFNLAERTKSKMKGNYMRLNGRLNFGAAYKCKDHQPTKGEINGGKMDVKIIEVYQVVDDVLEKTWKEKPTDEVVSKKMDRLLKCESLAGIRSYNILLIGVIGAGKSSLCNTFVTLFAGECKTPATVGETTGSSVTNKLQWYTLNSTQTRDGVNVIDMRGYAPERTFDHELEHLLNGKLPTEYVFPKTAAPVSDDMLLKNPSLDDEVHLVCFVVDVEKLQVQQEVVEFQNSLGSIMETIRQKGIPVAAVATKIDKLCPRIDDDADNIYDSPKARDAVLRVALSLGLESKNVFPIVNFIKETKETTLSPAKRKLATEALDSMVHLAEDYIERHLQAREKQKEKIGMKTIHSVIKELPNRTLKVLLVGEVNSGKSSFIDSVMSFMTGKPCHKAAGCSKIAETTRESITEKFQLHRLKYMNAEGIATTSNVLFGDMPGFQQTGGVELEHVKMVIKGHVGNKCKIKYGLDMSSTRYKRRPTRRDRFNCVCIVMDIISVERVSQKTWKRLKDLVRWLQVKGIPFVVILTKIDQLNQLVQKASQSVELYSRRPKQNDTVIRRNTDIIVEQLGIKESMFFQVQNYVDEKGVSSEIDVRLQNVLQKIVDLGREQMGDEDDEDDDDSTESSDFDISEHVKDISLTQEHASSDERL